ncbi:MAG: homoserine kinase [Candidatus Marinimicrobia bacterium]|jgi:homoserine kinase|nr:homoserine kinase [Candidatus Neomarinimicrobiota bacterium]HJM33189.1 homoserine kinase [Candidatus Neomarinimicrobiota bacterium]
MPEKSIRVRATASVANVSCGFDCIGYAIAEPSDDLTIETQEKPGIEIVMSGIKADSIPTAAENNTAGKAILSFLNTVDSQQGFKIKIKKGIPPGSGIGSSAASAAAALVGVNELLGNPFNLNDLLVHGMAGEAVASGSFHADNIAPALLGGMILIRSYDPLDILQLPIPDNLFSTAILPDFTVNTKDARRMLPKRVPLKSAVEQAGNLAGFTLGLHEADFDLLGRSMVDLFAEPVRAELIPGYHIVQQAAMDTGAIGCGISGSGPALFALSDSEEISRKVGIAMVESFRKNGLNSIAYPSPIHRKPPEILD